MDKYAKIRDNNLKEQTRRFNEVMEKYGDIAELINLRRQLQNGFDLVLSSDTAFREYTKKIREINAGIRELLIKHGLPGNYLEPIYNCPACEDKGFYFEDGVVPVRCKCNTSEGFGCTFEDFNLELFSKEKDKNGKSPYEHMNTILKFAKDYCENFPNNKKPNLLFCGTSGLGKSFLATCMCSELQSNGFNVVKVNAFTLIEDFRNKHIKDIPYPENYFDCDFLVIDDIGTEIKYTNITHEYLFHLINYRIEHKKPTLIITNQNYDNCRAYYGERLASRIFDTLITTPISFFGKNLRLQKNN